VLLEKARLILEVTYHVFRFNFHSAPYMPCLVCAKYNVKSAALQGYCGLL
jgi:hypothetical protein